MGPLMPWLLAAAAAVAVADLVVPRPRPRRFPEDEPVSAVRAEPTRASATAVVDRAFRAILVARLQAARPRAERSPERPLARPAAGGRSVEELWDMAHCCDLLAVAAAAGSTVAGSVEAVGDVGDGPVASALGRAGADLQRGKVLADVIASLRHELGPAGQPLVTTLSTAASSGTPPAAALVRLADAERRRSRRRIEARVRRLPVLLLIPLVALVLPAFVMLTVVPVALSAARGTGALLGAATASAGPFPLPPSAPFVPRGGPP